MRHAIVTATLVGASLQLSVACAAEPGATPEMVVTATRVEREVFNTPQAVTILGDRDIQEANTAATPDLFKYAEGVYVQKTNLGGGSPFIRGLTGKQVLILVDGVRLNNSYYRFGPHQYLNTIDSNAIERIEVVRGPMSVLYGSDALGGTVNIITKRRAEFAAASDIDGLLQGYYESASQGRGGRAQFEGNQGGLGWIGGVTARRYDDLKAGGDLGAQVPSAYDEADGDLKLNYRLAAGQELIFAQQYTRQNGVPKTSEVTLGDKTEFNYAPQRRTLTYLEYRDTQPGAFDGVRLNVSYNRQKEGEEIVKRATPATETREITDVKTVGAFAQLGSRLSDGHRLVYGFEHYRDKFDTSKVSVNLMTGTAAAQTPGTPDGATYESTGVYLQDEIRLSARADLIAGLRYSRFQAEGMVATTALSLDVGNTSGSLNALYRLTPTFNLVGGVAQGFRAPNMEDFFGRVDFVNEIPNTNLDPEKSLTREIGLKYYSNGTSAELYYHVTDYEGFIDRATVSPGVVQRQNIQDANIRGLEGGFQHRFDRHWSAGGAAAWTRGEDSNTGEPLRRIPPLNGVLRLRYDWSARLWSELAAVHADRQRRLAPGDLTDPRIPAGGTPGYGVFHFNLGWKPARGHELLATIENLGDKLYKTHGSGIYAPGRGFNLTYRATFGLVRVASHDTFSEPTR
jgi:TonB-dependent heme/hemoglobin receptor